METLTHSQLASLLAARNGAEIIGLATRTDSKARKTNNPFGTVFKRSVGAFMTGVNYEGNVNKALAEQGAAPEFKSKERKWGEVAVPNRLVTHKGGFYVVTRTTKRIRKNAKVKVSFETAEGKELKYEEVKPFLPEKKSTATQESHGLEISEQVTERDFSFGSIYKARLRGKTYLVVPD